MNLLKFITFMFCGLTSARYAIGQQTALVPWLYEQTGKWGYKDSASGKIIIYPHFTLAENFSQQGVARVSYKGRQSYTDTNGRLLLPFYFTTLPVFRFDTIYINKEEQHYLVSTDSVNFFEYKKGRRLFSYPVNDYYGKNLTVRTFKGPEEQINLFAVAGDEKKSAWPENELVFSATLGNGKNVATRAFYPSQTISARYVRYPFTGNLNSGISTEYTFARYWTDTAIFRSDIFSLGIQHRVILSPEVSISFGLQPVVNRVNSYYKRGNINSERRLIDDNTRLSSVINLSLNVRFAENVFCGAGYRYLPSFMLNTSFPRHYLQVLLGFGF